MFIVDISVGWYTSTVVSKVPGYNYRFCDATGRGKANVNNDMFSCRPNFQGLVIIRRIGQFE